MAGTVWQKEVRLDKPGIMMSFHDNVEVRDRTQPYVSRAGLKLAHILETQGIDVSDWICLDIGTSTGGFADCLLKKGAKHVFCVDVGYGLIDVSLRNDPRVSNLEKTNARELTWEHLKQLQPEWATKIRLLTIDVSFISLHKIIPQVVTQIPTLKEFILLFKPQFEVAKKFVLQGGIVEDIAEIQAKIKATQNLLEDLGLKAKCDPLISPIAGKKKGNLEYLLHYERL
jgi:23S rRNA (cytidine1920-2'-O)/16S rRNA (cytidine1409-2'-O)-methyltransferase